MNSADVSEAGEKSTDSVLTTLGLLGARLSYSNPRLRDCLSVDIFNHHPAAASSENTSVLRCGPCVLTHSICLLALLFALLFALCHRLEAITRTSTACRCFNLRVAASMCLKHKPRGLSSNDDH